MQIEKNNEYPWIDYVLEICTGINHFIVDGVKVFIAMNDMNYPADSHVHNDIEFMCVKRQTLTDVLCEENTLDLPINHILPFMPMQRHGCAKAMVIHQYIAFAFPTEFYEKFLGTINDFDFQFQNIPFPASSKFDYLVGLLFEEYVSEKNDFVMKDLVELIFWELCRSYLDFTRSGSKPNVGLLKAKRFLDEHINLPFDLEETARTANMSKFYFCRLFKDKFGVSPNTYLLSKKIEKSKSLITTTNKSFTDIAMELGFDTLSHFTKQFKKLCGITPGTYKKTILK